MAKDNEYPYKHKHVVIKHGCATFYGDGKPSKEPLEALNKMAELAYEQCGGVRVDTGKNNALLPDVSHSSSDTNFKVYLFVLNTDGANFTIDDIIKQINIEYGTLKRLLKSWVKCGIIEADINCYRLIKD